VEHWGARSRGERDSTWAYGADELYLRAGLELPPASVYGGFEQMENGVGSVRFLQREIAANADRFGSWRGKRIGVVTGTSMGALMPQVLAPLIATSEAAVELIVVPNALFGPRVTTAGLLPGRDLIAALSNRADLDLALVPGEAVNDDGLFIDSVPLTELMARSPAPVRLSKTFADGLDD
jgi:NifB/MoaA-like Fe-S oxidoreductase